MTVQFHSTPRLPRGFRCATRNCGIKTDAPDLSLFTSDRPASAAGMFTRNQFPGAPIVAGREIIRGGTLRAIVVNSRVSNVGTGEEGIRRARRMGTAAAGELGIPVEQVLMSSTGVIGVPLPIDRIEAGLQGMAADLQDDPLVGARGMMTTDTYPKALSASAGDAVITWVAKGSGMIEPNLATMLVYIFTDAAFPADELDRMLRAAVHPSLNMLSVDSDTSTSDTCVLLANGAAGPVAESAFAEVLDAGCIRLAEMLARDGEGATKLLRATVEGAASEQDARVVAKSIINSPLVKTMAYGRDPNVGRVLMAVGKCFGVEQDPARISVWIQNVPVVQNGLRADFEDEDVRRLLAEDPIAIRVDLGLGNGGATAFGCDLTDGYVRENAAYYSS